MATKIAVTAAFSTPWTFGQIAKYMVRRGVPIVPVMPRQKQPLLRNWPEQATTDIRTVKGWIKQYGNDCNCGSVATLGGFWFLDCDNTTLLDRIESETGHHLPRTLTVRSSKGLHLYWKQTDSSRAMGNCANHTAPYEFDAQVDRKQVISPGSTHPSGVTYQVLDDSPIVEAPDWLCDWITAHSQCNSGRQHESTKHNHPVSDSFDFDGFCDHYDITYCGDGPWYVTLVCPYAGWEHEQSKRTGLYYDGKVLGFHCFAAGCGDPSIGDLIRKLNEDYEPYRGEIWPSSNSVPDLSGPQWSLDDEESPPATPAKPQEQTPALPPSAATTESQSQMVDPEKKYLSADELEALFQGSNTNSPAPTHQATCRTADDDDTFPGVEEVDFEFPHIEPKNDDLLPFPVECMYGKFTVMAKAMQVPYGFAYPALLTVACGLPIFDSRQHVRATLFTALLGGVNMGKTIVTDRAKASFIFTPEVVSSVLPVSDRGVIKAIGSDGGRMVFCLDELINLFNKCAISGSTLAPTLCQLWSQDDAAVADKTGVEACKGKVSLLGNLAVEDPSEFAPVMGVQTTRGLSDRMVYGIGPMVDFYPVNITPEQISVNPCEVPAWCFVKMHAWINGDRNKRRLGEIALRIALIQSSVNGDQVVTKESLACAFMFADWQMQIRKLYRPGKAETKEAECFDALSTALEIQFNKQQQEGKGPKGAERNPSYLQWSRIMNSRSLYRKYGSPMINRVKNSMASEGLINIIYELDEDGEATQTATPYIVDKRLKTANTEAIG